MANAIENKDPLDDIQVFDRFPKLNDELKEKGASKTVTFLDVGREVDEATLRKSGAKFPRNSIIYVVEDNGEKKEFWIGASNFSNLRELKDIRDASGGSLENVKVKITRIEVQAQDKPNWKFEKV